MKPGDKKLVEIFRQLSESDQFALLAFAEFLGSRPKEEKRFRRELEKPKQVTPKQNESVIAALKRLSASYPMLNKAKMLNETSVLVSQHVMEGRDRQEVISELEAVFEKHYQKLLEGHGAP